MVVIAGVLLVLILGASVYGLRTADRGPRWPFVLASALSGVAILGLVVATMVAMTGGRDTWNSWVSGSQRSETVTLWLVLVAGPMLLATCCSLLVVGAVLRSRRNPPRTKPRHVD